MLHDRRRCAIPPHTHLPGNQSVAGEVAEPFVPEDLILQTARSMAREAGLTPVSPDEGAALRLLAAAGGAKLVVEIGTGTGVSGLWLLRGMRPDGVLTTIDLDAAQQSVARRIFAQAGFAASRTRLITGHAGEVLPRLADGVYDMVCALGRAGSSMDAAQAGHGDSVAAALRLLRPGGMLVLGVRWLGSGSAREVVKAVREAPEWVPALLPAGDGLLCAVKAR
jgi:predicted O-methyltransferase YrrM